MFQYFTGNFFQKDSASGVRVWRRTTSFHWTPLPSKPDGARRGCNMGMPRDRESKGLFSRRQFPELADRVLSQSRDSGEVAAVPKTRRRGLARGLRQSRLPKRHRLQVRPHCGRGPELGPGRRPPFGDSLGGRPDAERHGGARARSAACGYGYIMSCRSPNRQAVRLPKKIQQALVEKAGGRGQGQTEEIFLGLQVDDDLAQVRVFQCGNQLSGGQLHVQNVGFQAVQVL